MLNTSANFLALLQSHTGLELAFANRAGSEQYVNHYRSIPIIIGLTRDFPGFHIEAAKIVVIKAERIVGNHPRLHDLKR